ncbi:hypothetical protein [Maritimibacter sp. DP1N21-5]|uniref:hypothetical protein n=1 Tax=Maritimibacter sp. DP1N21-5 TaxID=2836867 RepID=UPI001C45D455|nr:hypothetical protein [Maritimibacter sp. DP1N21-5]MBV7410881.1 hypothetical protein [Maritimibacter sp. DP1N21-5]
MSAALDIRAYRQSPGLVVHAFRGTSDALNVCFAGIGLGPDEVQPIEFARTATMDGRDNALFISDGTRSWFNRPGLLENVAKLVEEYAAEIGARIVRTLGHSMGGFMALILPSVTRVDVAVAYAPQASVHPEIAGDDMRWMNWRARIGTHRIRSVTDHLNDTTRYYVFHGKHPRERFQRDRFAPRENLMHIVIPATVHNVPQRLRRAGILDKVTGACFDGRLTALRELLAPLGARYRKPGSFEPIAPSADLVAGGPDTSLAGDNHDQL